MINTWPCQVIAVVLTELMSACNNSYSDHNMSMCKMHYNCIYHWKPNTICTWTRLYICDSFFPIWISIYLYTTIPKSKVLTKLSFTFFISYILSNTSPLLYCKRNLSNMFFLIKHEYGTNMIRHEWYIYFLFLFLRI